ncbi:hypothetical protein IEO21_11177 [Rhodonia placenta]|uniref:Uncharacterized protein n=1 Tax=Rhodonia placenta TaxID=104341 RepID=A0A8H7NR72_9APHY|nr:hypothetical protein IEO21_11177 [Postia placenta]
MPGPRPPPSSPSSRPSSSKPASVISTTPLQRRWSSPSSAPTNPCARSAPLRNSPHYSRVRRTVLGMGTWNSATSTSAVSPPASTAKLSSKRSPRG